MATTTPPSPRRTSRGEFIAVRDLGGKHVLVSDVAAEAAMRGFVDAVHAGIAAVDVPVNNAGIGYQGPFSRRVQRKGMLDDARGSGCVQRSAWHRPGARDATAQERLYLTIVVSPGKTA